MRKKTQTHYLKLEKKDQTTKNENISIWEKSKRLITMG